MAPFHDKHVGLGGGGATPPSPGSAGALAAVALGAGAGVGATLDDATHAFDWGGFILFTTGNPLPGGVLFKITFAVPFVDNNIFPLVGPGDQATAASGLIASLFPDYSLIVDGTAAFLSVPVVSPLVVGLQYKVVYQIRGKTA